jgi:uncharacterized membrane protein
MGCFHRRPRLQFGAGGAEDEVGGGWRMTRYILLYLLTVPVFFLIDLVWLGLIARDFYRNQIGALMADPIVWWAAILFYALSIAGIIFFAVAPAIEAGDWTKALLLGAAFGFFTYMTYDLTNLATLQGWPVTLAVVDIAWGTVLSGTVATLSYLIGTRVLGL